MVPAEAVLAVPGAPVTPPPPAPHRVPPPAGTALAALFPYVVPDLDATVWQQLHKVTLKAQAKAAAT
eukprot:303058-Prorocentrum_lima.AAC.1